MQLSKTCSRGANYWLLKQDHKDLLLAYDQAKHSCSVWEVLVSCMPCQLRTVEPQRTDQFSEEVDAVAGALAHSSSP